MEGNGKDWSTLFAHVFLLTLLGLGSVTFPQRLEQPFTYPGGHLIGLLSPSLVNEGRAFYLYPSFLLHYVLSLQIPVLYFCAP